MIPHFDERGFLPPAEYSALLRSFVGDRVRVVAGDITKQKVDALVNAANSSLRGGGGVDGAIHEAGGPEILAACEELRRTSFPTGLPTGAAVLTTGGRLTARFVIHTVGPIKGIQPDRDAELLGLCYRNSLGLAVQQGLCSVAIPAISTGIYGYPQDQAAEVASRTILEFLQTDESLREIRLVFYTQAAAEVFLRHQVFS